MVFRDFFLSTWNNRILHNLIRVTMYMRLQRGVNFPPRPSDPRTKLDLFPHSAIYFRISTGYHSSIQLLPKGHWKNIPMEQESPTSLLPILCKGISQQLSYHVIHNQIKATTVHNRLFPSEDGVTRISFNDKNKNPKIPFIHSTL